MVHTLTSTTFKQGRTLGTIKTVAHGHTLGNKDKTLGRPDASSVPDFEKRMGDGYKG